MNHRNPTQKMHARPNRDTNKRAAYFVSSLMESEEA
jgi:hypothetical protein